LQNQKTKTNEKRHGRARKPADQIGGEPSRNKCGGRLTSLGLLLSGCGTMAQLMYVVKGLKIDALYDGLEDSRVAVVCVSDASSYGPDSLTRVVGQALGNRLAATVPGITVIDQHKIENWKDTHGWNELDFIALGQGVGADKVVAVKIDSYSIHEGTTMYKGRATLTTSVYDLANEGQIVFSQGPAEYQFPRSHGRPAISTDARQFETAYLSQLVESISRNFYDHEKVDTVAEDAIEFGF
jgi:hypothetical protein